MENKNPNNKLSYEELESQIEVLNSSIANLELNQQNFKSNPLPSWLIFLRDPFHNSTEWVFGFAKLLFMVLAIISVIYALINFGFEIYHITNSSTSQNFTEIIIRDLEDTKDISNKEIILIKDILESDFEEIIKLKTKEKDLTSLKFIEHIFIFLIPLLVVIGLYFYFEANYESKLKGRGKNDEKSVKHSRDALNLTKSLFISSMMSYVIIKIIEKLFFEDASVGLDKLISYGVFLTLLMLYLLISHKLHRD